MCEHEIDALLYHSNELEEQKRISFEAHLQSCSICQDLIQASASFTKSFKDAPQSVAQHDLLAGALAEFDRSNVSPARSFFESLFHYRTAAALVLSVLVLAIFLPREQVDRAVSSVPSTAPIGADDELLAWNIDDSFGAARSRLSSLRGRNLARSSNRIIHKRVLSESFRKKRSRAKQLSGAIF